MNPEPLEIQLKQCLIQWNATPQGSYWVTPSSLLQPVVCQGQQAMIKISRTLNEQRGAALMVWWQGHGAAHVLAQKGDAMLLERITGERSLTDMANAGLDDEVSTLFCSVASRLHTPRPTPLPALISLAEAFSSLQRAAAERQEIYKDAWGVAGALFNSPQDIHVLHGDLHHENILDGGVRGWLAIDPKGYQGERTFDFANLFCNPRPRPVGSHERMDRQVALVCEAAALDSQRLLAWIFSWASLSSAWFLEDGESADIPLHVAQQARQLLLRRTA